MATSYPSIKIDTGVKRLLINDGPEFIEFNPTDIRFVEKFYQLLQEFEVKQVEYQARAAVIEADAGVDGNGVPTNLPQTIALSREVCEFMRAKIDDLFGAGTCQAAFGDSLVVGMFEQFFLGITPYIQSARSEKIAKYVPTGEPGKRRKVMK